MTALPSGGEHALPPHLIGSTVINSGRKRCGVMGLPLGDCRERHLPGEAYCYYHSKISKGLTEPTAQTYPVWPLPPHGYLINNNK